MSSDLAQKIHAYYLRHFLGRKYDPREDRKSIHIEAIETMLMDPRVNERRDDE